MIKALNLFIVSIALAAASFTAGCSGQKYTKEIAALDSLGEQLEATEETFDKLDTVALQQALDTVPAHLLIIDQHFRQAKTEDRGDTVMASDIATILMEYRSVVRPLGTFRREHEEYEENIEYSGEQVENLIHDLQNNLVDAKDAPGYIQRETQEAEKALTVTKSIITAVNENIAKYKELYPKVRAYIDSLSTTKK
jgi:hypothetical protein